MRIYSNFGCLEISSKMQDKFGIDNGWERNETS